MCAMLIVHRILSFRTVFVVWWRFDVFVVLTFALFWCAIALFWCNLPRVALIRWFSAHFARRLKSCPFTSSNGKTAIDWTDRLLYTARHFWPSPILLR